MPQAQYGPIKVPEGPPDDRFVYLSDVLPTAWQAVEYANVPDGGSVAVLGLGPIGEMATRIAQHRGAGQVIGVDLVPERLARAAAHGVEAIDLDARRTTSPALVRELTDGRGPDAVIDAVGMEAHGAPIGKLAQPLAGLLPDAVAQQADARRPASTGSRAAPGDRARAPRRHGLALRRLRRRGRPDADAADVRQADQPAHGPGQRASAGSTTSCRCSTDDDDPLGVEDFATHHLPLDEAPHAYEIFQKKQDGAFKVVLNP